MSSPSETYLCPTWTAAQRRLREEPAPGTRRAHVRSHARRGLYKLVSHDLELRSRGQRGARRVSRFCLGV